MSFSTISQRFRAAVFASVAMLCLLGASVRAQLVLSDPSLQWSDNPESAQASAKVDGAPMLLYLFTPFSYGCGDMEQKTFRDPAVVEEMKRFELCAIDISKNADRARSLQVFKVPTVIFYSPAGEELFRAVGFKGVDEFPDYLRAIPKPPPGQKGPDRIDASKLADPTQAVLKGGKGRKKTTIKVKAPNAMLITVMGDFNDWRTDNLPMNRHETGWWWLDVWLPDGVYHYKFYVDGRQVRDPNAEYRKWINDKIEYASTLIVGKLPGPEVNNGKVTFYYYNREAKKVTLIADFTKFQETPMFQKGDGNWGVTFTLAPGEYEYWFMVDDSKQITDERNIIGGPRGGSFLSVPEYQ